MKCPSLFHFYRAYYGGVSQGKVHFARAIIETGKQLESIFQTCNKHGYEEYARQIHAFALTKTFLRNFYRLADQHYGEQLFRDLSWGQNKITLPKSILGKRELYIPFTYCYIAKERRVLFFEYGNVDNALQWLPIFKTLIESFPVESTFPNAEIITYWDLMKGTTVELSYPESFLAPKERVIYTARKIIEQATGGRR